MNAELLPLAWERPWALGLLALPVLLFLLALRRRADRVVAASDLDVWRASDPQGAGRRPRAPRRIGLALLLALLALACAAVAIAGPGARGDGLRWIGVIDTSASMSLDDGGAPRRARAIESALRLAQRSGAELRWIAPPLGTTVVASPADAGPADAIARATPFAAWDVPGALWVTDAVPAEKPRFAGYAASGGAAVPGPVAVDGADRIDWDGAALVRRAGEAPARFVEIAGIELEPARTPLARVIAAWMAARDVRATSDPVRDAHDVVLRIRVAAGDPQRAVRAGRDGWTASGPRAAGVRIADGLEPWIALDGEALVASAPGRVEIAWIPGEPDDAAAFAVSWAELFDANSRPARGIVPLEERVAAGPAGEAAPADPARTERAALAWIPAALAAALALLALLARRA